MDNNSGNGGWVVVLGMVLLIGAAVACWFTGGLPAEPDLGPTYTAQAQRVALAYSTETQQASSLALAQVQATSQAAEATLAMETVAVRAIIAEQTRQAGATSTQQAEWTADANRQATQAAAATTTAQAWAIVQWTAQAQQAIETATAGASNAQSTSTARVGDALMTSTAMAQSTAGAATQEYIQLQRTSEVANLNAQVAAVQAESTRVALAVQRETAINQIKLPAAYIAAALLFVVLIWMVIELGKARTSQEKIVRDSAGEPVLVMDARYGSERVLMIGKLPGGAVISDQAGVTSPALAHPLIQAEVTRRAQAGETLVHLAREGRQSGGQRLLREIEGDDPAQLQAGAQAAPMNGFPSDAPWGMLERWQGGPLPLGVGADGELITANGTTPHLLAAGVTGSGKTRSLLRPVTAAALAGGRQVVALSRSTAGYGVFESHPNMTLIKPDEPEEVIPILQAAYSELKQRDGIIAGRDLTWDNYPGGPPAPHVLLVLDELGNLADEMEANDRARLWRWVSMLAREGRKYGVTFAAAVQEPTAKTVDLRFRRNCTRVAFQLGDAESSRALIGTDGAERLLKGQFLTVMQGLVRGLGFAPNDEQIAAFLAAHPAKPLPKPEWLEDYDDVTEVGEDGMTNEDKIAELYRCGKSLAQIQVDVFGYSGGSAYTAVKRVVDGISTTNTTTTAMV